MKLNNMLAQHEQDPLSEFLHSHKTRRQKKRVVKLQTKQKMRTLKQQYQTEKRHSTEVAKLQVSQTSKLEEVAKKIRKEMEAIAKLEKELEEIAEWKIYKRFK